MNMRTFVFRTLAAAPLTLMMAWAQQTPVVPEDFARKHPDFVNNRHFQEGLRSYMRHVGFGSPSGVPRDARVKARQASAAHAFKPAVTPKAIGGQLAANHWTNIGPAPETGGQIGMRTGVRNMSGRVTSIAVDPTNSNHWYIGTAGGGVWSTMDGGNTWTPLTDNQATTAIGALAIAPGNHNIIYAGTGEGNNGSDNFVGQGLLKSSDGGATWTLLGAGVFSRAGFNAILTSSDGNTVVAATNPGIAGILPAVGVAPLQPTGIYQSTDGGNTWGAAPNLPGFGTGLAADPTNFANQYAAIGDSNGAAANGLYRSTNSGAAWTPVAGPWAGMNAGRIAIAIAPSDPNTMYVAIQAAPATNGGLLGLWVTHNAFATAPAVPNFTPINFTATDDGTGTHGFCGWDAGFGSASHQCWYDIVLTVDPTNPNILYAGGIPLWRYDATTATWTEVSHTVANQANGIHSDQHALAFTSAPLTVVNQATVSGGGSATATASDPTTIAAAVAGTLLAGNDGGIWSSPDGGNTWTDNNTNLATLQSYYGSVNPGAGGLLLTTGMQDNGTATSTSNAIGGWPLITGGDGGGTAIASNLNFAVSAQNQAIYRTTDGGALGGASFPLANGGIITAVGGVGISFQSAVVKCPANNDVLLTGTNRLYKATHFFTTPFPAPPAVPPALWADDGAGVALPDVIRGVAFAPSDATCQTYAFGTTAGSLFLTQDGGAHWTNIQRAPLPARGVSALAFDPGNANILYAAYQDYSGAAAAPFGHVYRTANALNAAPAWADVSPPVDIPFDSIAIDGPGGTIYAGCDMGVWRSSNSGANWTQMGPPTGMPNVPVFDLQIANGSIVAFTHGRGVFIMPTGGAPNLTITKTHTGNFTAGGTGTYTITVTNNGTGPTVGTVTVTETLPAGLTLSSMSGGATWNCAGATCTRTDPLAAGASYPPITVTVNVSSTAAASVTNTATVSGGGSANATANDPTTIVTGTGGSGVTLTLGSGSGTPGSTVQIPLSIATVGTLASGFNADLVFDTSKLTFAGATAGAALTNASKTLSTNPVSSGDVKLLATGVNQNTIADGVAAIVSFTLSPGFTSGTTQIALNQCVSSNPSGGTLTTTCAGGDIGSGNRCDLNSDGNTSVGDVQTIINMALGVTAATAQADLNRDGAVNVSDVQILINVVLGKAACPN